MAWDVIDEGGEYEIDLDEFDKAIGQALQRAANILRTPLATPPSKKPGQKHLAGPLPGGFYTNRQRNFVIGAINRGIIKVPYIRTGNLPRSWSISDPEREGKDLTVTVFTDPTEAPYNESVQQDDKRSKHQQVPMHKDWPTPNDVADQNEKKVESLLREEMKHWGGAR